MRQGRMYSTGISRMCLSTDLHDEPTDGSRVTARADAELRRHSRHQSFDLGHFPGTYVAYE